MPRARSETIRASPTRRTLAGIAVVLLASACIDFRDAKSYDCSDSDCPSGWACVDDQCERTDGGGDGSTCGDVCEQAFECDVVQCQDSGDCGLSYLEEENIEDCTETCQNDGEVPEYVLQCFADLDCNASYDDCLHPDCSTVCDVFYNTCGLTLTDSSEDDCVDSCEAGWSQELIDCIWLAFCDVDTINNACFGG